MRLRGRDDIGRAGRERLIAHANGPREVVDPDAMPLDQVEKMMRARRVLRVPKNISFDLGALRFSLRGKIEVALMRQQCHAQFPCGAEGRKGGSDVIADGKGKRELPVSAVLHKAARAGLFQQHAHAPIEIRIGRSLADIKIVEGLPRKIKAADLVERVGVALGDLRRESIGARRGERVVARGNARRKKERGLRVHLVVIREHIGFPGVVDLDPPPAFGLLQPQPVAVEIKPIVVGAAARPDFAVLSVLGIRNEVFAAVGISPVCKPAEAIRVQHRVEQDDGIGEEAVDGSPLGRGQVIGHHGRGIATAGFVPVDAVSHIRDHGHGVDVERGRLIWIRELLVLRLYRGEVLVVFRRRDGEHNQGPFLMRLRVFRDGNAL